MNEEKMNLPIKKLHQNLEQSLIEYENSLLRAALAESSENSVKLLEKISSSLKSTEEIISKCINKYCDEQKKLVEDIYKGLDFTSVLIKSSVSEEMVERRRSLYRNDDDKISSMQIDSRIEEAINQHKSFIQKNNKGVQLEHLERNEE